MLQRILLIALALALFPTAAAAAPQSLRIATYSRLTGNVVNVRKDLIGTRFADGSPVRDVSVTREGGRYFLVRSGGRPKACRTERAELQRAPNGALELRRSTSLTTCSGNPCASCKFTGGGTGCKCADGGASGFCNHTISGAHAYAMLGSRAFASH